MLQRSTKILFLLIALVIVLMCPLAYADSGAPLDVPQYDRWVWVGDSRTVGMGDAVEIEMIAKVGARIGFLQERFDEISELRGCNVIFNLGVNDITTGPASESENAARRYLDIYQEFPVEFLLNNNVCFMSVNPTSKSRAVLNANIENFNAEMRRCLPEQWTYLDTYGWMMTNGFESSDGVHYTKETYCALHDCVTSKEGYESITVNRNFKSKAQIQLESRMQDMLTEHGGNYTDVWIADNATIFVTEFEKDHSIFQSDYVIADIYVKDAHDLKTYYADDERIGLRSMAEIDRMSEHVGAILSCNGDFYAVENSDKEVLRNGVQVLSLETGGKRDYCVINNDGTMLTYKHQDIEENPGLLEEMRENAWQIWTFGPCLLDENGKAYDNFDDVYNVQLIPEHPRTAIGYFEPNHYCLVMVSGRVHNNKGASMLQLAQFFETIGCQQAYNLDGGGTSHMWFNGKILSDPCEDRTFSDIIYVTVPDKPNASGLDPIKAINQAAESIRNFERHTDIDVCLIAPQNAASELE